MDLIANSVVLSNTPKCESFFPDKIQISPKTFSRNTESVIKNLEYWLDSANEDFFRYRLEQISSVLVNVIQNEFIRIIGSNAFYLPADRTGIMHAHSLVVSSLIASAPMAGLRETTAKATMTGVLADFLEQLIMIDSRSTRNQTRKSFYKEIEKEILKGEIDTIQTKLSDYPEFVYRPEGWKEELPLSNASSMVSELAPMVLLLKHEILPGDLLIIEEPESHLHPAMQVKLTSQLAQLVNKGIRIVVTTHSEWLLEKLSNIVSRSKLRFDHEQSEAVSLSPDQVGVWLFQKPSRGSGTKVKEIKLDDTGQYPHDYSDVAEALHNEWAKIQTQLENCQT